jgi:predicted PurR-regulated permease PerM
MKSNSQFSSLLLFLIGLASLGVAVFFFHNAASLLNAFVTALIIVFTVSPVMFALKRKGAPTWAVYIVTVLVLLAVLVIFTLIVVGAGKQFMNTLPEYSAQVDDLQTSIKSVFDNWGVSDVSLDSGALSELFNLSKILNVTGNFISGLVDFFSNGILIGILILFMLVDAVAVPSKMASYVDAENPIILRLRRYTELVRRYIGITTIVGLVTGILDMILFTLVGVDFALLWGIIAFLFSFIPTIGFWIALIPPVTLALLQFGFPTALLVFFGIVIINGFAENIVKPKFMGVGLNLSFFTVFFSVVVWSAILGSMGAILSIPLTLAFKVLILEGDEGSRWFFDLISNKSKTEVSIDSNSE